MYKVIYTDLINKKQEIVDEHEYHLDSNELCLIKAEAYVLEREGIRYLQKVLWKKNEIVKAGYYIVKGKTDFNAKYKIYKKERNGFLYAGDLKKICYFQSVLVGPSAKQQVKAKKNNDFDFKSQFDDVIFCLPKQTESE